MSDEIKRIPRECENRTNNNFKCATDASGSAHTPNADGSDCVDCPNYRYAPSREAEKAKAANSDAKKGSAFGTAVLVVFAVAVAAGIFALTALIKSCIG